MSQNTLAVLERINALSAEERSELISALAPGAVKAEPDSGLDLVYEALAWRYIAPPDAASRIHDFRQ